MMKNNIIKLSVLFLAIGIFMSSCYKEERWTEENTEVLGYVPLIAAFTISPDGEAASGTELSLDLRYWCTDPIKEIIFYPELGGMMLDSVIVPYVEAYSEVSQTDSLIFTYVAPTVVDTTLELIVNAKVVAENGFSRETSPSGRWYRNYTKPVSIMIKP
ncbi:MAG TPA: hypothetical protein ENK85_05240 [Saprospiraceae bacterium]|nr:hypothetical protein [Saprospiraceae bacterium]